MRHIPVSIIKKKKDEKRDRQYEELRLPIYPPTGEHEHKKPQVDEKKENTHRIVVIDLG